MSVWSWVNDTLEPGPHLGYDATALLESRGQSKNERKGAREEKRAKEEV